MEHEHFLKTPFLNTVIPSATQHQFNSVFSIFLVRRTKRATIHKRVWLTEEKKKRRPLAYGVPSGPKFKFWTLLVLLAFDFVVLQFVLTSAIQHSSFQFLYSNWRFDIVCFIIQHPSLRNSTSKFTQFNIQLWKISNRNPVNDSQRGLRKLSKSSLCRG